MSCGVRAISGTRYRPRRPWADAALQGLQVDLRLAAAGHAEEEEGLAVGARDDGGIPLTRRWRGGLSPKGRGGGHGRGRDPWRDGVDRRRLARRGVEGRLAVGHAARQGVAEASVALNRDKAALLDRLHCERTELLSGRGEVDGGRGCQVLQQRLLPLRPVGETGGVLLRLVRRHGEPERRPVLRRGAWPLPTPLPDDEALSEEPSQRRAGGGCAHDASLVGGPRWVQGREETALVIAAARGVVLIGLLGGAEQREQPSSEVPGEHEGSGLVERAEGLAAQPSRQVELGRREGEGGVLDVAQGANAADLGMVGEGEDDAGNASDCRGAHTTWPGATDMPGGTA